MIRANDANGTTWGAPVTVATGLASFSEHAGKSAFSAKLVLGQPAVAYHSRPVRYVRATNASGTTWGASVLLDAASTGTERGVSLETTSSLPSVAYFDVKNAVLKFIRLSDFSGGSWKNAPVTVASGVTGNKVTLLPVGGAPAISTVQKIGFTGGIHLVRAKDALGATWSAQVAISDPRERYRKHYPDIVLVAGRPGYFGERSVYRSGHDLGLLYSPITAPTITWMAQAP